MKKRLIKAAVIGAVIIVIAGSISLAVSVKHSRQIKAEVAKGVEVIRNMETVDAAQIENKIRQMEEDELKNTEEYKNRPINVRYEGSLILGDSQAEALVDYQILGESEVIAHKGAHIKDLEANLETIVNLNPKNIFITYGTNDLGMYGSKEEFAAVYKAQIQKLQEQLPDAKLYVNLIFPVTEGAIKEQSHLSRWQSFNEGIAQMCAELGITCIDSNALVNENTFGPDGIHMVWSFYGTWAQYMADTAGL